MEKIFLTQEQEAEIQEVIDASHNWNLHGMTYEEGIRNALDWILTNDPELKPVGF